IARLSVTLLLFTFVLLLSSCISHPSDFYRYQTILRQMKEPPYLQIYLTSYSNQEVIMLKVDGGYKVCGYTTERERQFTSATIQTNSRAGEFITVKVVGNEVVLGDAMVDGDDIVIVPDSPSNLMYLRTIPVKGETVLTRPYRGRLRIKIADDKINITNIIDLESYLPGVVSSEMDENWPAESLAAQAITARSFAFYRIKQSKLRSAVLDYDLTDDIFSQVYRGEERTGPKTRQAVESTRGVIMLYDARIFNCLYHDTCAGHTEPGNLVFGLTAIAPLSGKPCGFCTHSKHTNWQLRLTQQEIISGLKLEDTKTIESIRVTKTAPGGHALEVALKIPNREEEILMNAQKFRIALGPNRLRSTMFRIEKIGNDFVFTGHGWGHAVGLCQEGARGMSNKGYTPLQILEYYYPEVKVVKIY
ncbi:MAG: SpoIID/LytB domain-containing protein, partial [Planctomycetes bacterium]|nr:SpoIID/LytB domain-containing protein [Planctomycetota bacterium]